MISPYVLAIAIIKPTSAVVDPPLVESIYMTNITNKTNPTAPDIAFDHIASYSYINDHKHAELSRENVRTFPDIVKCPDI